MLYRLFLMLLALNLVTMFTHAHADEMDRYIDDLSVAQIGSDNTNSVPSTIRAGECIQRVLGMLGNQWLKDLIGNQRLAEQKPGAASLGEMLRESEYDLRFNDEDVLLNVTYRF